jgi:transcriptional regulator with XRE-family HTH domain
MMTGMDSEIGARLRYLRKQLQLSQTAFGQKLGVSSVTISTSESGKRKFTPADIKLICLMYHINEQWLCTGEGPIVNAFQDCIIPGLDDLIETFKLLNPIHRKMALGHAHYLLDSQKKLAPDPDLDPDPEPVIQGRPSYHITESDPDFPLEPRYHVPPPGGTKRPQEDDFPLEPRYPGKIAATASFEEDRTAG